MRWLPSELRNQIFRDVLCVGKIDPWGHSYLGPLTPGLLSLNRGISAGALDIFYGENCFDLRIFKSNHTATFIHNIGSNAKKIKVVHIDVNLCPDDSGPDQDTTDLIDLLRKSCENLIKVIVSMPEKCDLDTAAAAHVVSKIPRLGDIEISIYSEEHNGTETLPVEIKLAKQHVMDQYSNRIDEPDCLECSRWRSSPDTAPDRHPHLLGSLARNEQSDASFLREINLMILCDAKDMKEIRYPEPGRTIISANGKLRHVEWEDFSMQFFFTTVRRPMLCKQHLPWLCLQ
ncbi:hypothetical protein IF2G_07594 [Cordyceps javanica]|nr:hypothetical protein IF2G_07594 [Cordyceps javanica]